VGIRTHNEDSRRKNFIRLTVAALGAEGKTFARRYNILRKQVLGTRTIEEGTSVINTSLGRYKPAKDESKPAKLVAQKDQGRNGLIPGSRPKDGSDCL
jgi:hypothetical protein